MMLNSQRGSIIPPNLDDRTWQNIVDQVRALIPKYAPQWTDHNPSDLGIALIELFAWLVEGLTYRLNRVPEKNYIAFLNLLGITRDPAVPAQAFLTFSAQPGAVLVPKGSQAQTQGSEIEAPIVFETDKDITVLPVNMKVAFEINKSPAAAATTTTIGTSSTTATNTYTYANISNTLTASPANGPMLTVPGGQSVQLCLGFDQQTAAQIQLLVELFRPVLIDPSLGNPPGSPQVSVSWVYSSGAIEPSSWNLIPQNQVTDGTLGLQHDGTILLTLPADWASQAPSSWASGTPYSPVDVMKDPYFWIGIRLSNVTHPPIDVGIGFDYLLFNSVSAHNALTISVPELLGQSNGQAFQVFPLQNYPLYKRTDVDTPYDHLVIQVDGTTWTLVDDFPAGAGNFYRLNPVAGEVSFGDFDPTSGTGHGSIPPTGSRIVATTYRYVAGGLSGNVGAGRIGAMRTPIVGITSVTNLFSSFGAADEEPIEETMSRAPESLKIRDRAVTLEDYEFLALAATNVVAIARCLPPQLHGSAAEDPGPWAPGDPWMFGGIDRSPGNVNVIIVPDQGPKIPRPDPTIDLLHEVQQYLDKRRNVTAHLLVTRPRYLPIKVVVTASSWNKAIAQGLISSELDVQKDILSKIQAYLHPIHGGLAGQGWQIGQSVFIADLFKAIMPDENVGFISSLTVEAEIPAYHYPPLGPGGTTFNAGERPFPLPTAGTWVRAADYELVCFGQSSTVTVTRL